MPEFATTPIFLISGLIVGGERRSEPVRVNGLVAFPKPFSYDVLHEHISLHLAGETSAQAALAGLAPGWIHGDN